MDKNILLSVVCLAYNHEKYISKALNSFVMQKTNFRFEVIVHDDASTDNTANIIKEFEKKYPDIIKPIYQTENQYKYGNISKRFIYPIVRGKYIALCEGDDFWLDENKIQEQVDYLERNTDCSYVFHNAVIIWNNGKIFKRSFFPDTTFKNKFWESKNKIYRTSDVINLGFIPTASLVARADLVKKRESFCEKPICGDLPLRLWLSLNGYGYYINKKMSAYRTGNPNSASGVASKNYENMWNTFLGHKKILDGFNMFTNFTYDEEVQYDINRRKLRTLMQISDYQTICKEKLKEMFWKETTNYFKIKFFLRSNCSEIFVLARKVRNYILGFR